MVLATEEVLNADTSHADIAVLRTWKHHTPRQHTYPTFQSRNSGALCPAAPYPVAQSYSQCPLRATLVPDVPWVLPVLAQPPPPLADDPAPDIGPLPRHGESCSSTVFRPFFLPPWKLSGVRQRVTKILGIGPRESSLGPTPLSRLPEPRSRLLPDDSLWMCPGWPGLAWPKGCPQASPPPRPTGWRNLPSLTQSSSSGTRSGPPLSVLGSLSASARQ